MLKTYIHIHFNHELGFYGLLIVNNQNIKNWVNDGLNYFFGDDCIIQTKKNVYTTLFLKIAWKFFEIIFFKKMSLSNSSRSLTKIIRIYTVLLICLVS